MAIMRSRVYCGDSETFREIVPRIGRAGCCLFAAAEARVDKAESALQWIEQHGGIALVAKAIAVAKTEENNDS